MSIIKQLIPQCDICHETFPDFIDTTATVKSIRAAMKVGGWRTVSGKDICWMCCETFGVRNIKPTWLKQALAGGEE
jgi:hypothetical protein